MKKDESKAVQTATDEVRPLALAANDDVIAALDNAAKFGAAAVLADRFKAMFMVGAAVQQLRALLTPKVMAPIMALQNNPLGFLTDRPNGYDEDTVRTAIIQAAIEGLSVTGNEFNILASRMYITKNGMKRKLGMIPGLLKHVTAGIPKLHPNGNGAIAPMHLDWTYNGTHRTQDLEFAVKLNKNMGADGIMGKATRKALAWLYEEVTGNAVADGDISDMDLNDITPRQSPLEVAQKPEPAALPENPQPELPNPEKVEHAVPAQVPMDYGDIYDIEDGELQAM